MPEQTSQEHQTGQYKCGQCGQSFKTQSALKNHEEERHARGSSGQDKAGEPQHSQGAGSSSHKA